LSVTLFEKMPLQQAFPGSDASSDIDIIMRTEGISRKEAEEKVKLIQEEKKANMPAFAVNPFNAKDPANMPKEEMPMNNKNK
jgi:hypothetical protein